MGGGASKKKKQQQQQQQQQQPKKSTSPVVPAASTATAAAAPVVKKELDPNVMPDPLPNPSPEEEDSYKKEKPGAPDNQVGGHGGKHSLLFKDGKVWKPVGEPGSARELPFYERIFAPGAAFPLLTEGNPPLVPKFYGTETVNDPKFGEMKYMVLDDLAASFKHPSILDLKMGIQTWDADCSAEKKEGHIQRDLDTTSSRMGFRFCGMKRWDTAKQQYVNYPKHFGWTANSTMEMEQHLVTFLHDGKMVRSDAIASFMDRLEKIKKFMETGKWRFYAASILFIYEEAQENNSSFCKTECRLIDFAHSWEIQEEEPRDEGFIYGISKVEWFLQRILNKTSGRSVNDVILRL